MGQLKLSVRHLSMCWRISNFDTGQKMRASASLGFRFLEGCCPDIIPPHLFAAHHTHSKLTILKIVVIQLYGYKVAQKLVNITCMTDTTTRIMFYKTKSLANQIFQQIYNFRDNLAFRTVIKDFARDIIMLQM